MVQTRPYADRMNQGNFALMVVDYVRFDFAEAACSMEELNEMGIPRFRFIGDILKRAVEKGRQQ